MAVDTSTKAVIQQNLRFNGSPRQRRGRLASSIRSRCTDPDGTRLTGFDNAHAVPALGGRKKAHVASDHWHRTTEDEGRPYDFIDAESLLNDFFDELERILAELGVSLQVVSDKGKGVKQ